MAESASNLLVLTLLPPPQIGPLLGAVIAAGLFRITNHSLFLKDGQKPGCCASIAAALMESIGT